RYISARLSSPAHIFDKAPVASLGSSGSQDNSNDRMSGILRYNLFGFQLSPAVSVDRVRFIRLAVPSCLPVEDFPAGQEDEGDTLGELREVRSGFHIDAVG